MIILCDSREKWTHPGSPDRHISGYFERHGIEYKVQKLDVGDYMLDGGNVSVDRKQNLEELSHNLTNKNDRSRFWREARRAKERGIKLIVLIEHGVNIKDISDVAKWNSKYSPVKGQWLIREMRRIHFAYSVNFCFCDKRSTAKRILEILNQDVS